MKINHQNQKSGYATVLTVVLVGVVSLTIFNMIFSTSIISQEVTEESTVRQDAQAREDAFLDALIAIVAERAQQTMSDTTAAGQANLTWQQIFTDAMVSANLDGTYDVFDIVNPETGARAPVDIIAAMGVLGRNGDPADFVNPATTLENFVQPINHATGGAPIWVRSGTGANIAGFPAALNYAGAANDSASPIISDLKTWGALATAAAATDAGSVLLTPTSPSYEQNNIMSAPASLFKAMGSNATIIGKRNWWSFDLNIAGAYSTDDTYTPYVLSIYELPMQQPISSTSVTNIGQHADAGASNWSGVDIRGAVYGKELALTGTQTLDYVASQRDIVLTGYGGDLGGVTAAYDTTLKDQGARENYEIANGAPAPLSMGQDSGRSAFISINRGLEFYDLDAAGSLSPTGYYTGILSDTNWDEYTHGATQCAMRVVVTEVVSDVDQTPTEIQFRYSLGGVMQPAIIYSKLTVPATWPAEGTTAGDAFPFHAMSTGTGRNALTVHLGRIPAFLEIDFGLDAVERAKNHSLLVQSHVDPLTNVVKPSFPSLPDDLAVVLLDGQDLTGFTSGFSVVTLSTLFIGDNLNIIPIVPATIPETYPPLSLFAPETRFGISAFLSAIDVQGQIGNISQDETANTQILDLKSGIGGQVVPANITANLYDITHPDQLPPIYTKNWLITIER